MININDGDLGKPLSRVVMEAPLSPQGWSQRSPRPLPAGDGGARGSRSHRGRSGLARPVAFRE